MMQAPITEEVVFRACVLVVYHLAHASRMRMIFLCPLLFGAGGTFCPNVGSHELTCLDTAHVHHAWETYNRYGRTPAAMKRAAIGTGGIVPDMSVLATLLTTDVTSFSIHLH